LGGYPSAFLTEHIPTIVVGREQADLMNKDPQNSKYMKYCVIADVLDSAMDFAHKVANVDKIIVFDGVMGGMNVSESLAKLLTEKAKKVSKRVDKELLPKWLRQRGIDLDKIL